MSRFGRDCDEVAEYLRSSMPSWPAGSSSMALSLLPSECKRFSRPSTRLRRASSTSVLGPLFLGTASGGAGQTIAQASRRRMHTIDARAVEDLTGFAGRASPVALDLVAVRGGVQEEQRRGPMVPCACGSSCSSWPRAARWRHGGQAGGRCRSGASTFGRRGNGGLGWTLGEREQTVKVKAHVWRFVTRARRRCA